MSLFERYLTLWVALCIVAGVALGHVMPGFFHAVGAAEVAKVNLPMAVLIWLMVIPMLLKIDFASLRHVGRHWRGIGVTLFVNWAVKPFSMAALGWLFIGYLFRPYLPAEQIDSYIAGLIILAAAPCTAMVFVWSNLTRGEPHFTLSQVALNDTIMVVAFAPIVGLLLGLSAITVPWGTLVLSVVLYIVIPVIVAQVVRRSLLASGGQPAHDRLVARLGPVSLVALLATLVLLFGFQGEQILAQPAVIGLLAVPILIQVYLNSGLAYLMNRAAGEQHCVAGPSALIGASNFFELAVAAAISLFGFNSGAALATVVGVLIEVPVMLSVVWIVNRTQGWYERGAAGKGAALKPTPVRSEGHSRLFVISALGVVEILAWGSSFYLPAVLAAPIANDTAWPLPWVVGGLSIGLLVAAFASPPVGLTIHRHGGRPVLALAALLLAAGLVVIGLAPSLPVLAGWVFIGLGMGCGLYDPAFATLGRLYGAEARPAITTLTLWGGFASTVCWPLSAFLVEQAGWRGACLAYAGLHVLVTLPLVLGTIPKPPILAGGRDGGRREDGPLTARERRAFLLMAGVLMLGGTVMTLVSVHLITLLQARGVALAAAVSYGALIGPAQVGARVLEMANKGRQHPLWTLTVAIALVVSALAVLALGIPAVGVALVLYGAGNGIYSIARGTVPLALFGPARYPVLVGRLARPGLIAQAIAPSLGAVAFAYGGADAAYGLLVVLALVNVGLACALWAARPEAGDAHAGPRIG